MRVSGNGWPPPSGAGGMPGGLPGAMPGGSKAPKRSNPGSWREAAELASEAARAEGAFIPDKPSSRRATGSCIGATSHRAGGADLSAAHQAEQAGPLLGMGGNQQAHGGSAAPARQPGDRSRAVSAVGGGAVRDGGKLGAWLDLLAGRTVFALGGLERGAHAGRLVVHRRVLSSWPMRGAVGAWPRWCWRTTEAVLSRPSEPSRLY